MHVITRKENECFQNIIKFLMSEIYVFCVNIHAKALNKRTSLKTTFLHDQREIDIQFVKFLK